MRSRLPISQLRGSCIEGTIYFAKCGDRVKIGFSANASRRLHILQTGNADPIEMIGRIRGTKDRERRLHERFKKLRVRGEWFRATPQLLRYIYKIAPDLGTETFAARYLRGVDQVDGPECFD